MQALECALYDQPVRGDEASHGSLDETKEGTKVSAREVQPEQLIQSMGTECFRVLCQLIPAFASSASSSSCASLEREPLQSTTRRQESKNSSISQEATTSTGKQVMPSNLLAIAIVCFLGTISSPKRPTILVLDDLQWADPDSLIILKVLLQYRQIQNLLFLGIYRDNEEEEDSSPQTRESHAQLHAWLQEVTCDDQGTKLPNIHDIAIFNLDHADTSRLVLDLLGLDHNDKTLDCHATNTETTTNGSAHGLVELIYRKTNGNPFFVVQFLLLLHKNRSLQFNYATNQWQWDLVQIQSATSVANNVAAMLTNSVKSMPSPMLFVLQLAACLGFVFDLDLLEQIYQLVTQKGDHDNTCALLRPSMRKHQAQEEAKTDQEIQDLDVREMIRLLVDENYLESRGNNLYRFIHDRVQSTVYELIPAGKQREDFHWFIGRYIHDMITNGSASRSKFLFLATDQLNRGCPPSRVASMPDKERIWLMKLNFEASQMAQDRHGLDLTGLFLDKAKDLIRGETDWDTSYEMLLRIYNSTVSLETSRGRHDDGIAIVDIITRHAKRPEDTVVALASRSKIRTAQLLFHLAADDAQKSLAIMWRKFTHHVFLDGIPRVASNQTFGGRKIRTRVGKSI